jgi:hypothetical protein
MKFVVEMASGSMIYIPLFIRIASGIQKLVWRNTQIHRQQGDLISLLLFFQNKESRLKKYVRHFDITWNGDLKGDLSKWESLQWDDFSTNLKMQNLLRQQDRPRGFYL